MSRIIFLCALVACMSSMAYAQSSITYTQLQNFTGQWNIQMYLTKTADKNMFEQQICNSTDINAACNQPGMNPDQNDKVKVIFGFNGTLSTLNGTTPKTATLRFCFSRPFIADRPWRKFNAVISKDRSCPLKVADVNITATNATNTFDRTWSLASKMDMASATLYAMVQVQCEQPAGGLDFCQFDSTQNSNNFATQKINSITPALVACVIACSIIGPAFMLAYFVYDSYIKKDV